MYCGFGRSDPAIKAAVQKDRRTQRVRVAQASQPSRSRIGDARSRFRLSKKLIRAPPTGASKGLARDSRRVQLGYTRGEGVAVQNSQVSIVVFVNELKTTGPVPFIPRDHSSKSVLPRGQPVDGIIESPVQTTDQYRQC